MSGTRAMKATIVLGVIAAVLAEAAVLITYLVSGRFDVAPFAGGILCLVIAAGAAQRLKAGRDK